MPAGCDVFEFSGRIKKIINETHDVNTLVVSAPEDFSFIPGQYCMVTQLFNPKLEGVAKPLTFANSPAEKGELEITFKKMGAFTSSLYEAKEGHELKIKGPCGRKLNFDPDSKKIAFLAGGTGITPFMSALRYATVKELDNQMVLFFGNQTPKDIIYRKELDELDSKDNITIVNTVAEPDKDWEGEKGFISAEMIKKYIQDPKEFLWYICGPPAMNDAMKAILHEFAVDDKKIRIDPWELPGKTSKE